MPFPPPPNGLKMASSSAKMASRSVQDLPKTILKTFLLHRLFRLRFWSVLAPTWAPFDPPLGAQDDPKIDSKNVRKSRCRKMASKIAPRRPKIAPRRPRIPQRAPKDPPDPPPDPPKCAPRASKIAPRALKFAPRASKSSRDVERKVANKHCNFKSEDHAQSKAARRSPRRKIRRPQVRRPRTQHLPTPPGPPTSELKIVS